MEDELEGALVVILNERLRVVVLVFMDPSRLFKGSVTDKGQDMEDQIVTQFVQPRKGGEGGGGGVVSCRLDSSCRPRVFGARGAHCIGFPTSYCFLLRTLVRKERGVAKDASYSTSYYSLATELQVVGRL